LHENKKLITLQQYFKHYKLHKNLKLTTTCMKYLLSSTIVVCQRIARITILQSTQYSTE